MCHHLSRHEVGRLLCLSFLFLLAMAGEQSPATTGESKGSLAKACNPSKLQRRLYVTTVDGALTALDVNGRTLWHYDKGEPLFSSSLSHAKEGESIPNLIPALDKDLYHWNGTSLHKLPFTADDLIDHSSFSSGYGSALVGAKVTELLGINVKTGKPLYECTPFKCHRYDNKSLIHELDVLKVSVSRITVREARELSGEEIWNFTVANMELSVIEGMEGSEFNCGVSPLFSNLRFQVDTLRGVLYAIDSVDSGSGEVLWERQLSAPIVGVWQHEGGWLEQALLSSQPVGGASSQGHAPQLMLVNYNGQYYLQSAATPHISEPHPLQLDNSLGELPKMSSESCFGDMGQMREFVCAQQTYKMAMDEGVWLESSLDVGSAESEVENFALMPYYNDDVFSHMCTPGPNGLAVYFYQNPSPYLEGGGEHCTSVEENKSSDERETCLPPQNFLSPSSKRHWLITAGIYSLQYGLFGAFVLCLNKLRRYHMYKRRKRLSSSTSSREDSTTVEEDDEDFPLLDNIAGKFTRMRSSSSTSTMVGSSRSLTLPSSGSSTETLTSPTSQRRFDQVEGLARFGSDYDLMGRLGKGGFGVVYHVRNRFDGLDYAVKRIRLPNSKSSREKVMREVRALAQLDHPTIIRYYNSWVEKAPSDWNEMEEWMPLSRQPSIIYDQSSTAPSTQPSMANGQPSTSCSTSLNVPGGIPLSSLPSNLSPCPSFNSLNHSYFNSVVPPKSTDDDSRSSSFVIEFREESMQSHSGSAIGCPERVCPDSHTSSQSTASDDDTEENSQSCDHSAVLPSNSCFSKALLSGRDELSYEGTTSSLSTTDEHEAERRDSITDLVVEPPTFLFIQMQLCKKESLKDWLASHIANRRKETAIRYFEQVLDAVLYVHRKGMMHRDLKPSNIFFALDGGIKVGDFGLVTGSAFGHLHSSYVMLKSLPDESYRQHTGNLGSHFYMSPEQMLGQKYDQKVDVFSLGVIFFELHYPFATEMERAKVLEDLRAGGFPRSFRDHLPLEADFVDWLMSHRPGNRPSAQEVFDSMKWHTLKENAHSDLVPKL